MLRSINYLCKPGSILHDTGVTVRGSSSITFFLCTRLTSGGGGGEVGAVGGREDRGGGRIDKPLALSANG